MNILVTTFGLTWPVLPELIGFTNPGAFDFYGNHSQHPALEKLRSDYGILPCDELWIIHTDSRQALDALERFKEWMSLLKLTQPLIRTFSYSGIYELGDAKECRAMSDLVLRTVLKATETAHDGQVIISLTGGRKNMSTDIFRASEIFGCSSVIHVADHLQSDSVIKKLSPGQLLQPLASEEADQLNPMVLYGKKSPHAIVNLDKNLVASDFPVHEGLNEPAVELLNIVDKRMGTSNSLLLNNYQQRISISNQTSFYGLQILPPKIIQTLENEFIGTNLKSQNEEYLWLKKLPKAELHCHLGGVLSPSETIEVALSLKNEIDELSGSNPDFKKWIDSIRRLIDENEHDHLRGYVKDSKTKLRKLPNVPEPFGVAAFLSLFREKEGLLDKLIYGDYLENEKFYAIGIKAYEILGDLQGSGLLKHPKTLTKTCQILKRKCEEQNIHYCEIRCSPEKYVNKDFESSHVVEIIHNELNDSDSTLFQLIIIGSRHNDLTLLYKHAELARELSESEKYRDFFAGFDIAGDESVRSPLNLKPDLDAILHECIKMTIHAGEDVDPENIWEAAYELNADRIGHGLTLERNPKLMKRFADRKISLEMCPSSNFQIAGFRNFLLPETIDAQLYPLGKYFASGIKVTVNTDNPGISRTDLSRELLLAAQLTEGGLSKWDILKIIRNGFKAAFLDPFRKKELILKVENKIAQHLLNYSL